MLNAIVSGRVTNSAELRLKDAVKYTTFTVASHHKSTTTFVEVVVFGKLAELAAQFITKGSTVTAIGRLEASAYTSRDGQPKPSLRLVASDLAFDSHQDESPAF